MSYVEPLSILKRICIGIHIVYIILHNIIIKYKLTSAV